MKHVIAYLVLIVALAGSLVSQASGRPSSPCSGPPDWPVLCGQRVPLPCWPDCARHRRSPAGSPGALGVRENGTWLFGTEYYDATGSITVSSAAPISVTKVPLGYRIDLTWTPSSHTFAIAEVTRYER